MVEKPGVLKPNPVGLLGFEFLEVKLRFLMAQLNGF